MSKTMSADGLDAALPWYAAGTLDAREADQVEAALAADNALADRLDSVREEMTATVLLNEALGAPSARVMDDLFKAIDRERTAPVVTRSAVPPPRSLNSWRRSVSA